MNQKLFFTDKQTKAWDSLVDALNKCEEVGILFAFNGWSTLYGYNGNDVKDTLFAEDTVNNSTLQSYSMINL